MQLPEEVQAVRFKSYVQVGPKGTPAETAYTAGKGLAIRLDRGCVVLFRTLEGRTYAKAVPLSGGNVLEVDYGELVESELQEPTTLAPEAPPEVSTRVESPPENPSVEQGRARTRRKLNTAQ